MPRKIKEIERKFLVKKLPAEAKKAPRSSLRQGYLVANSDGAEVRIRQTDNACYLTVKSGKGLVRGETEIRIRQKQFNDLWPLTRGRRIRKDRYSLSHEGVPLEVDVYRGKNRGLVVAEVEFPSTAKARRFLPPDWMRREITGAAKYSNARLARGTKM